MGRTKGDCKMKTIVKLINVNDGNEKVVQNGERLFVQSHPKTEAIIGAFLNAGYVLNSRTYRMNPSVQGEGQFSFYIGGWDLLFTKEIDDEEEDDSDIFLEKVISEIISDKTKEDEEFDDSEFWDMDMEELEEDEEFDDSELWDMDQED